MSTPSPWRNPMVWLMLGLPAAAVVAGLATLWIAVHGADPLVDPALRREHLTWKDAAPASNPPPAPADADP